MENKKQFKPYDRVLVRDSEDIWRIDLYSNWDDEYKQHLTLAFGASLETNDSDILPYEGNEHLVGTTDEPEEEIELMEGEWVAYITGKDNFQKWTVGKFHSLDNPIGSERKFQMKPISEKAGLYCVSEQVIRFSDFNPENMEETRKHILCVKNGKVVKYKE